MCPKLFTDARFRTPKKWRQMLGASQFVPMSSRNVPTRTQVNSYPLPSHTQVISYEIPTRTQLVPKSQLTRTQQRTYRLVALVWHTN